MDLNEVLASETKGAKAKKEDPNKTQNTGVVTLPKTKDDIITIYIQRNDENSNRSYFIAGYGLTMKKENQVPRWVVEDLKLQKTCSGMDLFTITVIND